ncbi:MAG TPA: hypothetical protein VMZ22_02500 [Acidimicrobiales bacterium]|nr:hypothetical protein [Acidimicrobiales bacterium]
MGATPAVIAFRIIATLVAAALLVRTLVSAVRSFVVPRDEPTGLTRFVFILLRVPFYAVARRRERADAHRVMRAYAPSALLLLPVIWIFVTWLTFAVFYWAIGEADFRRSIEISGSSVTSLGTYAADGLLAAVLTYGEAALGLGLVALLITYLPTIYAAYQRREREVSLLSVRAGTPPSGVEMLVRFQIIGLLDDTEDLWTGWEAWFVDIEESHTSMGSLAHFQSGLVDHSWITASGAVLDGAALLLSSVDVPPNARAQLCIRSGFLALRHVADYFDIAYDHDPAPTDPISVTRAEYDQAVARLRSEGVPVRADRDQAWRDFAGWRVNYDKVLLDLCSLVWAPPAMWSGDRSGLFRRPPLTRRAGRGHGTRTGHERML